MQLQAAADAGFKSVKSVLLDSLDGTGTQCHAADDVLPSHLGNDTTAVAFPMSSSTPIPSRTRRVFLR